MKSEMINDIIANLMFDLHSLCPWFSLRSSRLTHRKVMKRYGREGISFLTKSLPRLGKAFDKALCEGTFDYVGFRKDPATGLPRFLGEFFVRIFDTNCVVLAEPCIESIRAIRQVCNLLYKYELPYDKEQEAAVVADFISNDSGLPDPASDCPFPAQAGRGGHQDVARRLLSRVLASFHPITEDFMPRHGPGSLATGEQPWEKFQFKRIYTPLEAVFPFTEFFVSGLSQVADEYQDFESNLEVLPSGTAKVVLVPKDSRGPRLISMEPLEYQWIQQGIMRGLVRHVEHHPLTRRMVNFTDQSPNRVLALESSRTGAWATLDMKEASDRVSLALVRALFPPHVLRVLEATRTCATKLPDGSLCHMKKFAPMGSALCFPVEALCFWALIVADRIVRLGESPRRASQHVLVFGDDIIVPRSDAIETITRLESYGLLVNRSKSCIQGFFRESCGVDAYKGINITPLRLKKVWRHRRDPSTYVSWIAYSNDLWKRGYRRTAVVIAQRLGSLYGAIPRCEDGEPSVPAFCFDPIGVPYPRKRFKSPPEDVSKPYYSVMEEYVWYSIGKTKKVNPNGWCELFRALVTRTEQIRAGSYVIPRRSMLRRGWRRVV